MGHCHSCRSRSGGPVNAFSLWKPAAVRVTAGAEHVASFEKTPLGLVDVCAATLPTLNFIPGVHVNFAETVLRMRDGLLKLKDFPTVFGGSGALEPD